ncbi:deaminase [Rhodococcus sp. ACPA4]|uniref:dihydrofolate reductase family protein n=1 Tax=Rhodococcus sp. ACPA4 TaxID=2028571 RepID=UPI000BB14DAB|nr:dihydrofolate reductase family protein [Rhodococcus sp. ACPA4]PBC41462.1 deaminase [Rhodococcus sp. ACPA4]
MVNLEYSAICSIDGYVADKEGNFDWAMPDAEVHGFANNLERDVGTHLYGRRMYEIMAAWETMADPDPIAEDFARIWRRADKVVYSTTLAEPSTQRTRIERTFDSEAMRAMKASATQDISIGGPTLAAHALAAGLVDEIHLFLCPVIVGSGLRALSADVNVDLELMEQKAFRSGVVYLRYRVR